MELLKVFLSLALVAAAWIVYSRRRRGDSGEFPPGPPGIPIFGNMFQLGIQPHTTLAEMAKTYGPLMSLKLGTQNAVVVSSPEMVTEVLTKQGLIFSNRSNPAAMFVHGHEHVSVGMAPATSDQWKKLRRIGREKLFSNLALQANEGIRHAMLEQLADHVGSLEGKAMNIGEATFTTMFNLIFATFFSVEYFKIGVADSDHKQSLKKHVSAITRNMGLFNISDSFPILRPLDPQGIRRKVTHHLGEILNIVGSMIEQRLKDRKGTSSADYQKKNDFLETLLDLMEGNEYDLSMKEIKHFCTDLLFSGSDTSAATAEWTMLELLLHPDILAKVRAELKSVVGDKKIVKESDIAKLPYFQATIKESLRYHPIAPLLAPREAIEDTKINGYKIPKNTRIISNFWAITRNPKIWPNPDSFEPERFLDREIDYQGQHSDLVPFGSGRRICPGMPLAGRMVHCMVATLCLNFDWDIEGGRGEEAKRLQREDVFGLALQKKTALWAIPTRV